VRYAVLNDVIKNQNTRVNTHRARWLREAKCWRIVTAPGQTYHVLPPGRLSEWSVLPVGSAGCWRPQGLADIVKVAQRLGV
jgi:hypothetical protein